MQDDTTYVPITAPIPGAIKIRKMASYHPDALKIEHEMYLLGSGLLYDDAAMYLATKMREKDFYAHVHVIIYVAIVNVWRNNHKASRSLVAQDLLARGNMKKVGGLEYLTAISEIYTSYIVPDNSSQSTHAVVSIDEYRSKRTDRA